VSTRLIGGGGAESTPWSAEIAEIMPDIYPMDGRSNYQPGDYNSDTDVFLVAVSRMTP